MIPESTSLCLECILGACAGELERLEGDILCSLVPRPLLLWCTILSYLSTHTVTVYIQKRTVHGTHKHIQACTHAYTHVHTHMNKQTAQEDMILCI